MTVLTVEYNDSEPEPTWVLTNPDPPPGALVAAVFHGLAWTVSTGDPTQPVQVELPAVPSPFVTAAVLHLIGAGVADLTREPPPRDEDGDHLPAGEVTVRTDHIAERAAMGLLALASLAPDQDPLRAIDTAALLHRAGLDALRSSDGTGLALPDSEELADDADEALDMLPQEVLDLAVEDPSHPDQARRQAAEALADARAFVAVASVERLLADLEPSLGDTSPLTTADLDDLDDLLQVWRHEVIDDLRAAEGAKIAGPVHGLDRGDRGPGGSRAPRISGAFIADRRILGVRKITTAAEGSRVLVAIDVTTPHVSLLARLVDRGNLEVLDSQRLVGEDWSTERSVTLDAGDATEIEVQVVRDAGQPIAPREQVVRSHIASLTTELQRQLSAAVVNADRSLQTDLDGRKRGIERFADSASDLALTARSAAEELARHGEDVDHLVPSVILSKPSDALGTIVGLVGEEVVARIERRAQADPAHAGAEADDLVQLIGNCFLDQVSTVVRRLDAVVRATQPPPPEDTALWRNLGEFGVDDGGRDGGQE